MPNACVVFTEKAFEAWPQQGFSAVPSRMCGGSFAGLQSGRAIHRGSLKATEAGLSLSEIPIMQIDREVKVPCFKGFPFT